jgi:hypothetical protein
VRVPSYRLPGVALFSAVADASMTVPERLAGLLASLKIPVPAP